ncbi:MAG: endonuclease/exonuclease/phosphatase family protein, partial [Gammaproteobacteria bacterium]|nr:endonuclease/exonuclease/phosphatase family protein [Gammaproteobacteria bacterium]
MKVQILQEHQMSNTPWRWSKLTGRWAAFSISLLALALGGIAIQPVVYAAPERINRGAGQVGKCSIPNGEVIKIASWNINGLSYQQRRETGAFETFVAMVARIDADLIAFQEVTPTADEIFELAFAMQDGKRCYHALVSAEADGEKFAVLFDAETVELLYPKGPIASCDASTSSGLNEPSPLMRQAQGSAGDGNPAQLAY